MTMAFLQLLTHIALFLSIALAYPPLGPDVHVRSSPELSVEDVVLAVQRDLAIASLTKRQELNVATSLERSWNGAVLLKLYTRPWRPGVSPYMLTLVI